MRKNIDINADLGEGIGNDSVIMPLISSCNIACGGHYGDDNSMRASIQLALKNNVKIGAHPSYPDPENFGRQVLKMSKNDLTETLVQQLLGFRSICKSEGTSLHHIKLHGALYNFANIDETTAEAVLEAIAALEDLPKLYVPFNSILAAKAKDKLTLVYEAFIDRRYNDDLSLVGRYKDGAVINSVELAWEQLFGMLSRDEVISIQNSKQIINADTFCIHGDNDNAEEILQYIRLKLKEHSINLL